MTRTGPTIHLGDGDGNIARARFCNRRHAALMVRIHADGSGDRSLHGVSTLVPAWHRGWTDDIYARSVRAGRALQTAVVGATGAANRGVVQRSDLTGFNWADVPAVLVETGFMTNPTESQPPEDGRVPAARRPRPRPRRRRVPRPLARRHSPRISSVGRPRPLVHGGAAALDVGLVHRRLRRGGFLVLLLDDRARLLELAPQLLGPRVVRGSGRGAGAGRSFR